MAGTMKLYEMPAAYEVLLQNLEDHQQLGIDGEGEIPPEIMEELRDVEDDFHQKCENIVKVIQSLVQSAMSCKDESHRLMERVRTMDRKVEWLRGYLFEQMTAIGCDRVNSDLFAISLAKKAPRVQIVDLEWIPTNFFDDQEPRLRKKDLLDALKAGEQIAGAKLVTGEQTLRIR